MTFLKQHLNRSELSLLRKTDFPERISPMIASKVEDAFDDPAWIFEIKWDGYRILGMKNEGRSDLISRSALSFSKQFPPVDEDLLTLPHNVVLDGEVVCLNEDGSPDFGKLQNPLQNADALFYYVFDLLWLDGYSLLRLPLLKRKTLLRAILTGNSRIRYNDHFNENGKALLEQMKELGLEGVIAKKADSIYEPGKRVKTWLKIPLEKRQEFVIGGWTESDSGRAFRSLLFGAYENGKLVYAGHAGGGYKENEVNGILEKLKRLEIKKKPFINDVETSTPAHWVKPVLVAEIKFSTLTHHGKIRKPAIFLGFRKDKDPKDVVFEFSGFNGTVNDFPGETNILQPNTEIATLSNWPLIEEEPVKSENLLNINKRKVRITNIEKMLWEKRKVTKADLINYYIRMAEFILPHVKDRPLSLHVKINGPVAPGFYIKDMENKAPSWVKTFTVKRVHPVPGKRSVVQYMLVQDLETLVYMINLGCIDVNPWLSRISAPDRPDYCVLDLDPTGSPFEQVVETALAVKAVLDKIGCEAYLKTSGKTGLHVYIPLGGAYPYKESETFALSVARVVHSLLPGVVTLEREVSRRGKLVYIDYLQNLKQQTLCAAYSVRPYIVPNVSMPIDWQILNTAFKPFDYHIHNVPELAAEQGDLFLPTVQNSVDLERCRQMLESLLE